MAAPTEVLVYKNRYRDGSELWWVEVAPLSFIFHTRGLDETIPKKGPGRGPTKSEQLLNET